MKSELERYIVGFDGQYHFFRRLYACVKLICYFFRVFRLLSAGYGEKKSYFKVVEDMLSLIWRYGAWVEAYYDVRNFVDDYFEERLYLVSRDIDKFILQYEGIRVFFAAGFKALKQFKLLDSKVLFHEFCDKHGLPHARCLGNIVRNGDKVMWKSADHQYHNLQSLLKLGRMFCKADYGEQGKGSFSLYLRDNKIAVDSAILSERELAEYMGREEMMVEEVLENHSVLKALHPSSLQTVRIVTIKEPHKDVFVLASTLRIGMGGKTVDNLSSGGICVQVRQDGILASEAWSMDYTQPPYIAHPDTGLKFESIRVPFWEECLNLVCSAHKKLPRIVGIGWDVAVTPTGPVLVEANNYFGFTLLQVHGVPYRWITEGVYKSMAEHNVKLMMNGRVDK